MLGQTVSYYKILEKLGEGGMGVVYRAEDTKLKRSVALKFLPPELSRDPDAKDRFIHEAQAASSLQHINICTIHDIDRSDDGRMFIAMDLYRGETLKKKIERGALDISEAVEIAMQIAQGLAEAHKHGIIHRDIKPENVLITDAGVPKILDFGLAKLSGRTVLTKAGMTVGTVAYSSPQQATGALVDHRTDIWSLGIMLYEMVTGRTPFSGDYDQAIIYQAINAEPEPVQSLRPDTPAELQSIIARAMQKDPQRRYQSAEEMLGDLQQLKIERGPGATAPARFALPVWKRKRFFGYVVAFVVLVVVLVGAAIVLFPRRTPAIDSVALLPFTNATGDSTLEYLSDGLTETLINRFSQLPHLHVIARTTAFSYKGKDQDPQKVGHALDVRAVLTGKIVQRGTMLTVQADLVDALDGTQLWGERYNRELRDILALQEEIAGQISDRLRLRLSGEEQQRLSKSYTQNAEAYQLYLKGRYWSERLTMEGFRKSVEYFNQAIEKDPSYALAYSGLADAYYWASNMYLPPRETMEKARKAAVQALERDSLLSEAHLSLALVKLGYEFDWPGTETQLRRAIELNSGFAWAHFWLGRYLTLQGRYEESIAELKQAKQLDPLSPFICVEMGLPFSFMRRYDEAIENARKTIEMNPSFAFAHYVLGDQYLNKREYTAAIAEYQSALRFEDAPVFLAGLGRAYAAAGEIAKVNSILRDLSNRTYPPAYDIALIYLGMGKKDKALEWFQHVYDDRNDMLLWLKNDPRLDPIRSDGGFIQLIRKLGLEK
jgi:TolB-like protein/tRNA A-37 threonylcarbamoyl transferase component Bud32